MIKITKDTKDTKREGEAGAGRACAQGARPARGPVGHGGLRTPCFGEGALARPRTGQEMQEIQERPQTGDGQTASQVFQRSKETQGIGTVVRP